LKTMELLATITQHFLLESNFSQHRKSQCWVTQHGVQTTQHFTQHQCWVNVGWNVGLLKQAFMLLLLHTAIRARENLYLKTFKIKIDKAVLQRYFCLDRSIFFIFALLCVSKHSTIHVSSVFNDLPA